MAFNGKRSARERIPSQVNLDPDLVSIIVDRAARNRRTKGAEIVHLLTFAILHDPEANIHDLFRMNASTKAQPHKVTHIIVGVQCLAVYFLLKKLGVL